jgi:N-acetylglucosaminyldiphosphoundecaprenol N-acetyl-beta-D-mannosaminyltransferase
METLCNTVSKKPITVGFLGGRDGVAAITAERLQKEYPGLKVGFVGEEPTPSPLPKGDKKEKRNIPSTGGVADRSVRVTALKENSQLQTISCDILFVAFGFPKQEEWMFANLSKLNVRVMMGVGGAFDYISGNVPRAPVLIQKSGFEWLYRLILQPWRWRRQVALVEFIGLVMKEKMGML